MKDLGIKITDTTKDFDLLISRGIFRTEKFLVALSTNVPILSGDWITDTIEKECPQDPSKYLLQDKSQELIYNFKLDQSRKNSENRKLLKGITVYITENVTPGVSVFKNLVDAAGGDECVLLTKKNQRRIKGKLLNSRDNLIISSSVDQDVYMGFKEMGFKVYSAEFILTGLLLQRLDYDNVKNCY